MNATERVIRESGNKQAMEEYNDIIHIMIAAKDYINIADNRANEVSVSDEEMIYYRILRNCVKYWWGDMD